MSVHFRGKCYKTKNVKCAVNSETHWNNRQPNLTVRGFATSINITDDSIEIV